MREGIYDLSSVFCWCGEKFYYRPPDNSQMLRDLDLPECSDTCYDNYCKRGFNVASRKS